VERQRRDRRRGGMGRAPSTENFLHFHAEMAHFGGILAVNFIFYSMSQSLQKKGGDLVRALHLVDDTTSVLQKMRNADDSAPAGSFPQIFAETSVMAQCTGVTLQKPRIPLGKSVHRTAAAAEDSVEDYYRVNVFNTGIDAVLTDFKARFGQHFRLSAGLNGLLPNLVKEKTWADVKDASEKYSRHLPGQAVEVEAEFAIWKQHWENISDGTIQVKHALSRSTNTVNSYGFQKSFFSVNFSLH